MNRHDIGHRHRWRRTVEATHSSLSVSIGVRQFLISSPRSGTWGAHFLFPQEVFIHFRCYIDYLPCANWHCFHQSLGVLEWGSELYRFEWVIFFLHIIPSRISLGSMPRCVLLDKWCAFPVLLSSYIENIPRKFFFRYHMKLIHNTCVLIYMSYCKVIFFHYATAY